MITLGKYILQKKNPKEASYSAFIPDVFPPKGLDLSSKLLRQGEEATRLLGKLDGISLLLPDLEFFLRMYIRKDASASSQIEGTMATMVDAIEAEAKTTTKIPRDVEDILHYISALNFGMEHIQEVPMSLRFIRDIHGVLMSNAQSTQYSDPGKFRTSQNWIGGTTVHSARYVPPPPEEMTTSLHDLEKFIVGQDESIAQLIGIGLVHAQFEMIHPFLDGNGRAGRMIIALSLWDKNLLDNPVLFLSSYFKKHQKEYYERLNEYHEGDVEGWLQFFLEAVIETAKRSIETVRAITKLREEDLLKIQSLGKVAAKSATEILPKLFQLPVVNVAVIQEWTGFTRQGAQNVIDRFIGLGILEQKEENESYGRSYIYRRYVDIFNVS